VGRAGLIYCAYDDTQPDIEAGYALIKSAWGKGYATELTRALIEWGFAHIPVDQLFAVINPGNDASRQVLKKSEMQFIRIANYWNADVELYAIDKPSRFHC
jgi:ribosomal-protein-alanine N-acetyltransferase